MECLHQHSTHVECGDGKEVQASSETETSDAATSEDFSDISNDSDIFHLTVNPDKTWITDQDKDEAKITYIASLLRCIHSVPLC